MICFLAYAAGFVSFPLLMVYGGVVYYEMRDRWCA